MNIPHARTTQDNIAAGNAGETMVAFEKIVSDAINTAIGNKATSATVTITSKGAKDVMRLLGELRSQGYKVANDGTTWTITW